MILKQFNIRSVEMGFGEISEIEFEDVEKAYNSMAKLNLEKMIKIYWTNEDTFKDLTILSDLHYMSNKLETKILRKLY